MRLAMAMAMGIAASCASGTVVQLTFEGVGDLNAVGNFYNGGAGTNYGVSFSPATLGIVDSDAGGSGYFANEPTGDTIMFFLDESNARMTYAAGFTTGFSFYYTSISSSGSVSVYDGVDGTGNLLATLNLPALGSDPNGGDPTGGYNIWANVGVGFAGTAKSVVFAGAANLIGFDNVTFGSTSANLIPLPTGVGLSCAGLALVGLRRRR